MQLKTASRIDSLRIRHLNIRFSPVYCSTGRVTAVLRLYTTIEASTNVSTELQPLQADVADGQLGDVKVQSSKYQHSYKRKLMFPSRRSYSCNCFESFSGKKHFFITFFFSWGARNVLVGKVHTSFPGFHLAIPKLEHKLKLTSNRNLQR